MYQIVATAVAALFVFAIPALPSETQAAIDEATKAKVREAIQKYVERDAQLKEAFLILDPRTGEPLRLAFDNVHAGVKPHEKGYVACVDFKDGVGKVYDVDIVVGSRPDRMEVAKVFIHKVEGKAITAKQAISCTGSERVPLLRLAGPAADHIQ